MTYESSKLFPNGVFEKFHNFIVTAYSQEHNFVNSYPIRLILAPIDFSHRGDYSGKTNCSFWRKIEQVTPILPFFGVFVGQKMDRNSKSPYTREPVLLHRWIDLSISYTMEKKLTRIECALDDL